MSAEQEFHEAFNRLINKSPDLALTTVTGIFVSFTLALMEARGYKPDGEIVINGGDKRDITIHAPKKEEKGEGE